jgi:hypothetical protein
MAQGPYNDPAFTVRQTYNFGRTAAGGAGTNALLFQSFPYAIRAQQLSAVVGTAGTATTATISLVHISGTTTTTDGAITLSTSSANTIVAGTALNALIPAGALCYLLNGADTVAVANVMLTYNIDPQATY